MLISCSKAISSNEICPPWIQNHMDDNQVKDLSKTLLLMPLKHLRFHNENKDFIIHHSLKYKCFAFCGSCI